MVELAPGAVFAGHRIEAVAGRGGMGVVYRATTLALDRLVALKVILPEIAGDPAFRERFKRESKIAARLDHPHVIPVYHAGEEDGRLYITMRLVDGTDLARRLSELGRLEPASAARLITAVGSALDAAHEHGLVHRDVKPANVLLSHEGEAYLSDFGLTKLATSESGMTGTGMFVGTLDYIAPEQFEGGPLDARADVYALGCVLFHVLTGSVPYPGETPMAKLYAHAHAPVPSACEVVPDLPAAIDDVISRGLAKAPVDRFQSAGDLARATAAALGGPSAAGEIGSVARGAAAPTLSAETRPRPAPPPTMPTGAPDDGRGRPHRRAVAVGAAALLVAAAVVGLVLALGSDPSEEREESTRSAGRTEGTTSRPVSAREAEQTVQAYARAVRENDRTQLRRLLSPDLRFRLLADPPRSRDEVVSYHRQGFGDDRVQARTFRLTGIRTQVRGGSAVSTASYRVGVRLAAAGAQVSGYDRTGRMRFRLERRADRVAIRELEVTPVISVFVQFSSLPRRFSGRVLLRRQVIGKTAISSRGRSALVVAMPLNERGRRQLSSSDCYTVSFKPPVGRDPEAGGLQLTPSGLGTQPC